MFYCSSSGSGPLNMSKTDILRGIITEKLSTAAREILAVVERTVIDYEEEASGFRQEMDRQRRQLELLQPHVRLHREDLSRQEVKVVEEEEQQLTHNTGTRDNQRFFGLDSEAESQSLSSKEEEEEEEGRPTEIFTLIQTDSKDPDYQTPSRSGSVRKRSSRALVSNKQKHLKLRIRFLEDPDVKVLSTPVFKKSPVQDLRCPRGLQETDFLDLLRSTFPQLTNGEPFHVFLTDRSRRLQPLKVKALTPEEISKTIRSSGNSALYVQLKKGEKIMDPPSTDEVLMKNKGAELHTSSGETGTTGSVPSISSASQGQDLQTEEEPENIVGSFSNGEEALDGGDNWNPDPERRTQKKRPRKERSKRTRRSEETKMSCKVCGIWYKHLGALIKHIWSHLDEQQDICGVCGEKLQSVEELKEHLRNHQKVHSCSHCGKTFVSISSLNSHMTKHTGNSRFKCHTCDKTFTTKSSLDSHHWTHAEDKPHKCDVCLKTFGLKVQLMVHSRTHGSRDEYSCQTCQRSFNSRRSLMWHRSVHSVERRHACRVCGKCFKLDKSLKCHMKTHTVQDRPFLCHVCSKVFPTRQRLMIHLKTHSSERPFVCEVCSKSFTFKGSLMKHVKVHSSEAPFQCSECGRCFKHKGKLKHHIFLHSGIKKFLCGICGKAFSEREYLRVHMRTHNGERPYKCTICEKGFTQSHCLKTHLKSHQIGENPVPEPPQSRTESV